MISLLLASVTLRIVSKYQGGEMDYLKQVVRD